MMKKLAFFFVLFLTLFLKTSSVSAQITNPQSIRYQQTAENKTYPYCIPLSQLTDAIQAVNACQTEKGLSNASNCRNVPNVSNFASLGDCTKALRENVLFHAHCNETPNQWDAIDDMCSKSLEDKSKVITLNYSAIPDPVVPTLPANVTPTEPSLLTSIPQCDDSTVILAATDFTKTHKSDSYGVGQNNQCVQDLIKQVRSNNCTESNGMALRFVDFCNNAVNHQTWDLSLINVNNLSPGPTEDPNSCGGIDMACCKGNPTQIQAGSFTDNNSKKNCFFVCPEDLFGWIGDIFKGSIGTNNTELQKLGFCHTINKLDGTPGGKNIDLLPVEYATPEAGQKPVPNLTPGDCICKEIAADSNAGQLCQEYIATAYNNVQNPDDPNNIKKAQAEMRACVACSFGEAPTPIPIISGTTQIYRLPVAEAVNGGVWTGMGCIYAGNKTKFIENNVMPIALGLGGIIAMLCIAFAAITFQTSAGNPEKVKNAQQMMTSCIAGLILIIFSIFILRLIGVDILNLPGFSK